jgi:hypothetical protein
MQEMLYEYSSIELNAVTLFKALKEKRSGKLIIHVVLLEARKEHR